MTPFEEQLLRLKQALGTTEDQEVAEALGLTKAAFAQRKKRGSFPAAELRVLAAENPRLQLDVGHVLTGKTQQQTAVALAAGAQVGTAETPGTYGHKRGPPPPLLSPPLDPDERAISAEERLLITALRQCDTPDQDAVRHLVLRLAGRR